MALLTFHGAVEGVTGSAYLLETETATVLLECGLFQGSKQEEKANRRKFPFSAAALDAVVISHAHLDHSGRLPMLVRQEFNGPAYMTEPTLGLMDILYRDAASLQERDAEWENRRRRRAGKKEIDPLYTLEHVEKTLTLCRGLAYGQRTEVAEGVAVRFLDAGHILGSAIVEVYISESGLERKLVFTGDLGNSSAALLRDPEVVEDADVLLLESTYGNREHRPMDDTMEEFEAIVRDSIANGGNILIPSFAVGRTQEMIFHLGQLYQEGKLGNHAIYLDSPMAISATEVYQLYGDVFNEDDKNALRRGGTGSLRAFLPTLRYSQSTAESMALNRIEAGAIIIAGSGMCNGGRIRHHLKHNLWRKNAHVIFVGFQARGTPGRALVDGANTFRIGGETIAVKANIHTLGGFSAHASQSQLLEWAGHFREKPRLYLVHGDPEAKQALQAEFQSRGWRVEVPELRQAITL